MSPSPAGWRRDAALVAAAALAARLAVVAWAAGRFPPVADGSFYQALAERLAAGQGYTWAWPDGAVTYAAHYPVGYPAALAAVYSLFGPHPAGGMVLNAVVGALAALAVHRLAARAGDRRVALVAGLLVALHPALVAYTPALMTEGVAASLVACAAWAAARLREAKASPRLAPVLIAASALGAVVGLATLVRPQLLVLGPLFALVALAGAFSATSGSPLPEGSVSSGSVAWFRSGARGAARPLGVALLSTAVALAVVAPWTARNCERMGRCALVSVNGGWNLLIGVNPAGRGAWAPLETPPECAEVFDEAGKDACFGRAAVARIRQDPAAWLALAPAKLAATFDYGGAAGYYLHESGPEAFPPRAKLALGVVETVFHRAVLLLALLGAALPWRVERGERRGAARVVVVLLGAAFLFTVHAWVSHLALVAGFALQGRRALAGPVLVGAALASLSAVGLTHAIVFGAGRYGLPAYPLLVGLAALGLRRAPAALLPQVGETRLV